MALSEADFRSSAAGAAVEALLADPAIVARMEDLARWRVPPVKAIDATLPDDIRLTSTERQHVGRMVRAVLEARGWKVGGQDRFDGGRQFASGSWYRRPDNSYDGIPTELLPTRERIRRAQAIVRATSRNTYGVDDYLRDKYAEAALEDQRFEGGR